MTISIGKHRQHTDSGGHEFFDVQNLVRDAHRLAAAVEVLQANGPYRHVCDLAKLYNATGGAVMAGIGPDILDAKIVGGQWDDGAGGDDFTDDTEDMLNSVAGDFALQTLVNNDGVVMGATELWSAAIIFVSTAEAGGGTVHEWMYWNGVAWAALTMLQQPVFTATGQTILLFEPPSAWAVSATVGEGIPDGYYLIRYRATTAPAATAALAQMVNIGHPLALAFERLPSLGEGTISGKVVVGDVGEGIMVAFGTHAEGNRVTYQGQKYAV